MALPTPRERSAGLADLATQWPDDPGLLRAIRSTLALFDESGFNGDGFKAEGGDPRDAGTHRVDRVELPLERAGRHRDDDLDLMAHGAAFRDGPGQGADNAVDLGLPGVSGQNNAHEGRMAPPLIGRNL